MSTGGMELNAGLSGRLSRLSENADLWGPDRVLDEGLDIARDATWSDSVTLVACRGSLVTAVAKRPTIDASDPGADDVTPHGCDPTWFPWGLGPVSPQRFLLISDAARLPASPESTRTLGDDGVASCLHMPLLDRHHAIGAIQLFWRSPRLEWNDEQGPLLRMLGRFLVDRWVDGFASVEAPQRLSQR